MLVRAYDDPEETDGFTTTPTPDMRIVINASGTFTIESRRARGVARARYRPGRYFAAKAAEHSLAVSYAAEAARFGIDTAIIVQGSSPAAPTTLPTPATRAASV